MLKWLPADRSQARDLLSSKWLQGRVTSSGTEDGPARTQQLNADGRPTAAEAQIHKVARRNATAKAKATTETAAAKAKGQAKEGEAAEAEEDRQEGADSYIMYAQPKDAGCQVVCLQHPETQKIENTPQIAAKIGFPGFSE